MKPCWRDTRDASQNPKTSLAHLRRLGSISTIYASGVPQTQFVTPSRPQFCQAFGPPPKSPSTGLNNPSSHPSETRAQPTVPLSTPPPGPPGTDYIDSDSSQSMQESTIHTVPSALANEEFAARPNLRTPIIEYIQLGAVPNEKWASRTLKAENSHLTCVQAKPNRTIPNVCSRRRSLHRNAQDSPRTFRKPLRRPSSCHTNQKARLLLANNYSELTYGVIRIKAIPIPTSPYDYFTKWIKAKSYQQTTELEVRKFIWKDIICRHGLPFKIVTDNGSQFIDQSKHSKCRNQPKQHDSTSN
ncbi:unnamed protein product [Microthlaspi erraticum]|uniref:Integrase catalytic domain-containing protein n=1 Tax=Microthlaspi erraticum TaxID=1685480 RepID=A0A6D2I5P7_9BRAS|nr:unnamed protein product [Microthlaspi erraticum]